MFSKTRIAAVAIIAAASFATAGHPASADAGVLLGNSDGAGIAKTGAGHLILPAANTYTGTTYVTAGTVRVTGDFDLDGDVDGSDYSREASAPNISEIVVTKDLDAGTTPPPTGTVTFHIDSYGGYLGGISVAVGDVNSDGKVDSSDYVVWRKTY